MNCNNKTQLVLPYYMRRPPKRNKHVGMRQNVLSEFNKTFYKRDTYDYYSFCFKLNSLGVKAFKAITYGFGGMTKIAIVTIKKAVRVKVLKE